MDGSWGWMIQSWWVFGLEQEASGACMFTGWKEVVGMVFGWDVELGLGFNIYWRDISEMFDGCGYEDGVNGVRWWRMVGCLEF
ncbi:hypothetical protein [Candidatus Hodgkinia cicadicola]|uniref:hypothetical protein n=1 Tax=Candidatus Hodgkinia cicadicola TaxID=573658 RepID=UPI001788D363